MLLPVDFDASSPPPDASSCVGVYRGAPALLKRLAPRLRGSDAAREAFAREGRLLGRLARTGASARVPRLLAHGEDDAGPYLVLGHLPGSTLEATPTLDADVIADAFAALDALHQAADDGRPLGVVHGDLHPGNVLLAGPARPGAVVTHRVVLLDLGLATARDALAPPGAFRGTLATCAPETARGEPPAPSADLFALAASFVLLEGRAPHGGPADLVAVAETDVLPAASARLAARGASRAVADALLACLAFAPASRPTRAADVAARLAPSPCGADPC